MLPHKKVMNCFKLKKNLKCFSALSYIYAADLVTVLHGDVLGDVDCDGYGYGYGDGDGDRVFYGIWH